MISLLPPRFIPYRVEWNEAKQKFGKYPCDAQGWNINALDPSRWMTFEETTALVHWDVQRPGPYGVGFVLNGDGWHCLDYDNVLNPDDTWDPEAHESFLSFAGDLGEVSISGKGLHVFGKSDPEKLRDRKRKWGNGKFEFYTEGRFIALSKIGPQPIGNIEFTGQDRTQQLLDLIPPRENTSTQLKSCGFLAPAEALPEGRDPRYQGPYDDDQLIALMRKWRWT